MTVTSFMPMARSFQAGMNSSMSAADIACAVRTGASGGATNACVSVSASASHGRAAWTCSAES